jgi:hypothetical protein
MTDKADVLVVSPHPEDRLHKRCQEIAEEEDFELGEAFHRVEITS